MPNDDSSSGGILTKVKTIFKSGKVIKEAYDHFSGKDDTKIIPTKQKKGNKAAILFLHGFGGNAEDTWGKFPDFFKVDEGLQGWNIYQIGYNTRLMPDINDIWSGNPNITELARFFKTLLEDRFKQDYKQIGLVAHSMGGLIVQRAILDLLAQDNDISYIHSVTLYGTPSQGLRKASLVKKLNNQIKDMAADGEFIKQLRQDWNENIGNTPPFKFLTCAGDLDDFVPSKSSLDPFPLKFQKTLNGNHITLVKPKLKTDISCSVLRRQFIDKEGFYKGVYDSAEIAIQLGDFKKALNKLEPNKDHLGPKDAVKYTLALEVSGDRQAGIDYLHKQVTKENPYSDLLGTLGGRYKREYQTHSNREYLEKAQEHYLKAYEIAKKENNSEQIYYHAINLAFLSMHNHLLGKAKEYAIISEQHANKSKQENVWKYATIAEAALYKEQPEVALYNYVKALQRTKKLWEKNSMHKQWLDIVDKLGMEELKAMLRKLFSFWIIIEEDSKS